MGELNGGRVIQQGSLRARPPRAISFLAGTGGLSRGSLRIWVDVFGGAPGMSFRMSRGDPIHHFHVGHHPMHVDPDDAPERGMGTLVALTTQGPEVGQFDLDFGNDVPVTITPRRHWQVEP